MNHNLHKVSANRHSLVLAGFALLITSILALTQSMTGNRIEQNETIHRQQALAQVLPSQWHDHSLEEYTVELFDQTANRSRTCYIAKIKDRPVAAIVTGIAPDGYSGDIELLVGILEDGTITGVRVTKHSETPGLGDAIELQRSDWITSFDGKSLLTPAKSRWAVKKQNGDFDQFTGATITPQSVINEVRNTLLFFEREKADCLTYD